MWIAVPSLWAQLGTLSVTPSSLSFSYKIGNPDPPAQTLTVYSSGSYQISVYSDPIEIGTGGWLAASAGKPGNPSVITVYARPKGYPPRTYSGRIVIDTAPSIPYAARTTIGVGLSVAPNGTISVTPSSLSFTTILGSVPAPKQLSIAGSATGLPFLTNVVSTPENWLSINSTGGISPFNLVVQAASASLTVGTYEGEIRVWLTGSSNVLRIPVSIAIVSPAVLPSIQTVINSATGVSVISPGSWITLFGSNLAPLSRSWSNVDFAGRRLPTALEGVRVLVDNLPAAVSYISPTQINEQAPDDIVEGVVTVQVTTSEGSGMASVLLQKMAPGLFATNVAGKRYAIASHADGSTVSNDQPAHPGEVIVLYGTGFGLTDPAVSAGQTFSGAAPIAASNQLAFRIGSIPADVLFGGLSSVGLYQFNVIVPDLADGDQEVIPSLGVAPQVTPPGKTFLQVAH